MGYLILILLISVLTLTVVSYILSERKRNISRRSFEELSKLAHDKFNITHYVNGYDNKYLFIIDKEIQKVIVMRSMTDIKTIPFRNIEGLELRIDEKIITSSKIDSSLGAVLGGSLNGTSYAILGALAGTLREYRGISKISVSIKSKEYSYTTLLCLDAWEATHKTKKYLRPNDWAYKQEYNTGVQRAKRIIELLIPIIENNYKYNAQ